MMNDLTFLLLILTLLATDNSKKLAKGGYLEEIEKAKISKDAYEDVKRLHMNWYLYALKALIGQLGKKLLENLNLKGQTKFKLCLDKIDQEMEIAEGAYCLARARDSIHYLKSGKTRSKTLNTSRRMDFIKTFNSRNSMHPTYLSNTIQNSDSVEKKSKFYRKFKLNIKHLRNIRSSLSARRLRQIMRKTPAFIRSQRYGQQSEKFLVRQANSIPNLFDAKKSPIEKISNLVRLLKEGQTLSSFAWLEPYKKLLDKTKNMKKNRDTERIYSLRLYDIIFNRRHRSKPSGERQKMSKILRSIYDLVDTIRESNLTHNAEILSPRIASVIPEELKNELNILSPAILSFYKSDDKNEIASIPQILKMSNITGKDHDVLLNLLMELTGAGQVVQLTNNLMNSISHNGRLNAEILKTTEGLDKSFKTLQESLSKKQKNEMEFEGFAFLESEQLKSILKAQGIKNANEVDFDISKYEEMSEMDRREALWKNIKNLIHLKKRRQRSKRLTLLSVLQPTILAPFIFSPVTGLTILGPVILSPNIFSPLILSPSVLSPLIMDPEVFGPFILSPYLLSPHILSPLAFAPFILTPYLLSPRTISPYVLSPLILSPFLLSPPLFSPQAVGGLVLSPPIMSPSVMSKPSLTTNFLSPSLLS